MITDEFAIIEVLNIYFAYFKCLTAGERERENEIKGMWKLHFKIGCYIFL